MLRCYICDEKGAVEEAAAICIACGIGLCSNHAKRVDMPISEGHYPMPVKILKKGLPRFMCEECLEKVLPEACI
jgi:hypothetical protein